jgi:putative hydrolase of the HAD superfamily
MVRARIPRRCALAWLQEVGWRVAIITNRPPSQEEKIRVTSLSEVVDTWCVSEALGACNPQPELFEEAARRCGAPLTGFPAGPPAQAIRHRTPPNPIRDGEAARL